MAAMNVISPYHKPQRITSSRCVCHSYINCNYDLDKSITKNYTPFSTLSVVLHKKTAKLHLKPNQTKPTSSGIGCLGMRKNSSLSIGGHGPLYSVFPESPAQVSAVEDLFEFICDGPLMEKVGLTPEKVGESIDKWVIYGSQLCRLFQMNELFLNEAQKVRIYHYYIPVFIWCEEEITRHFATFNDEDDIPPLVVHYFASNSQDESHSIACFAYQESDNDIFPPCNSDSSLLAFRLKQIGFSAPQGCGKTTLVFALDFLFRINKRKSATISIDDFYLTAEDQAKLRESHPGNALLEFRGNAGSHDLSLSVETLTALSKLTKEGTKLKLPRYDKSAYNGRGDRADPSKWPEVEGPLTVILFEGWMLGFKPVPTEVVKAVDPQLETINKNLESYYDAWDKFIKSWIVIKIQDPSCVYQWRLQAEIAMRADGKPGLSDEEVMDFVSRYLPAYKAYLPTLYSEGPSGSNKDHLLVVEIDEGRNPILGN